MNRTELSLSFARTLFVIVLIFSIATNMLMLVGPIFMLQIYDRVLSSGSEATLVSLFIMVTVLYAMMFILDYSRSRVLARIGARFEEKFQSRTFLAVLHRSVLAQQRSESSKRLGDLDAIPRALASPGATAVFDLPWSPIFFSALFIFHPSLGYLGIAGAIILLIAALANQFMTKSKSRETAHHFAAARKLSDETWASSELICAQGMSSSLLERWKSTRIFAREADLRYSDVANFFSSFTRAFRLFLQSAILALGAWLVLQGHLSAGAMIAGSILLGRALAPIEQVLGQWRNLQEARTAWNDLQHLLTSTPDLAEKIKVPKPKANMKLNGLAIRAPGASLPTLKAISLSLEMGDAIGVIGHSASGKSSLAKTLAGLWRPAAGEILLDGVRLDQYRAEDLGKHIGYLPQDVSFFRGTIGENIARMELDIDDSEVVRAAKAAMAHDLIVSFPNGYNTLIEGGDLVLSGGQRQRIALARALYGDPQVLILDEPNASLDQDGSIALNAVIEDLKDRGKLTIMTTHRLDALVAVNRLLILEGGTMLIEGEKSDVLKRLLSRSAVSNQSVKQEATGASIQNA